MGKLSAAQAELLAEVCAMPRHCVKAYKPGPALVAKGFAVWRDDDDYCGTLCITEAGRTALVEQEPRP